MKCIEFGAQNIPVYQMLRTFRCFLSASIHALTHSLRNLSKVLRIYDWLLMLLVMQWCFFNVQDIVLTLLKEAMLKNTQAKGFLIDGYPRELEQGTRFESEVIFQVHNIMST